MSISKKIKERIENNGARYWANDNISDFILPGEKEELVDELTGKFEDVLESLLIDINRDPNSKDTGRRLAKMYVNELFSGRYDRMPRVAAFPNNDEDRYDGMLVVRAELISMCSHHHQPVKGVAYIGIIPSDKVIGLSKYIRIAQWVARRGTLQEQLANEIANEIAKACEAENVGVYVGARHGCCEHRGAGAHSSLTQTTVLRGSFKHDASTKKEFFDNIKLQQQSS